VPQEALVDAAVWYTQLDQFDPQQVLENRLVSADQTMSADYAFLDDLASDQPTPGGGSAAAFSAAEAAALTAMVGRVSQGKKKYESVEAEAKEIVAKSEALREQLTQAIKEDAAAFDHLMSAFKLPKETEEEKAARTLAIHEASIKAAQAPLETARMSLDVLGLADRIAQIGNLNAITDAGTAGALSRAAVSAAGANVRINLTNMQDDPQAARMLNEVDEIESSTEAKYADLKSRLKERANIALL